ncbi:hypothetical protein PBAL39_22470 [Pedobacter sp. BAL39]|uniref:hypothetical protein n=1 Tax=Pedobacter sp. BAL39 TaxID=391596 RepID=UPI00015596BB|nr:hypothetical protein [Pedobacter sp. BAL39]EDM38885.1 hypothetical protein PBAL39_22470 [Pedobacter sp. BAL39]
MIKVTWRPLMLAATQNTSYWYSLKKVKDQTTARFANALECQINEDLNVGHDILLVVGMKKGPDKFTWDFSYVPESADGKEVISYIKNRRFANVGLDFIF